MKVHVILDHTKEEAERKAIVCAVQQAGLKLADRQVLLKFGILSGDISEELVENLAKIPGVYAVEPIGQKQATT